MAGRPGSDNEQAMKSDVADNSIAHLIRVAKELEADAETLRAAATMLGLVSAPVHLVQQQARQGTRLPEISPASRSPLTHKQDDDVVVRPAGDDPRLPRRPRLTPAELATAGPPRPLRGQVADLLPAPDSQPGQPEPLFQPAHQRAVLSTLASVNRPGHDFDIAALVELAARREPIGRVPRKLEPTTRLGVQLLVDHGPSMGPFRPDLRLLAAALRRVVGQNAVEVQAFRGSLASYEPASGGRPILVATDLGIAPTGGAVRPAEWLALARRAKVVGSPLIVLVPYPPSRWPTWARHLTLVHWDRPTSARHAQQAARRAGVHR
jgi:hypothetical protein